ncbi:MAG: putative glycoside hydrolase [Patescibacteria group bacterium]|nr:putative glycoside hydrolase [Patescibacteria group bacterium]
MHEFLDNYKTPHPILKKHFLIFFMLLFFSILIYINSAKAQETKNTYPKIANYYLHHFISDKTAEELSMWDVIILDPENQINNPEQLQKIKQLNPNIIILAYIQIQELSFDENNHSLTKLREYIKNNIDESWYLKDKLGNKLSFWPGATIINITYYDKWINFLPNFIKTKILSTNLWDGIFFDNLSTNISWFNGGNIDIDNNGSIDPAITIDSLWKKNIKTILTKNSANNSLIIGNSASDLDVAHYLNGRMFETFPTPWEGDGKWEDSMNLYLKKFPEKNIDPKIYIINSNTNNSGNLTDYKKMRFGLTSTLLGDGYFSFDYGDKNHGQTWYYDEYKTYLGEPISNAHNLLDPNNSTIKPGLWRRDFENGIVIVNSSNKKQRHVFKYEIFEKIRGQQDKITNNGNKINYIDIEPGDGIVLLKIIKEIYDSAYKNNSFTKIFNFSGIEVRNPIFHIKNNYKINSIIINSDIDNDKKRETIVSKNGLLEIYKFGQKKHEFHPYNTNFKLDINLAIGDVSGDGMNEIITGAGLGGGPHIRIFDYQGNLISQFFAYEKTFRGGVSVAIGDVNGDGMNEIITGAIQKGNSEIKIFNKDLQQIKNFFAYPKNNNKKIYVSVNDVDKDDIEEILISTTDF